MRALLRSPKNSQLNNLMYIVGKALFGLAILAYGTALWYMGSVTAEILSDLGNAIMLATAVLLLLGLTKKKIL